MDDSFARALFAAFAPDLKIRFQPRVVPLDIKLHVERIRLAELIDAARTSEPAMQRPQAGDPAA